MTRTYPPHTVVASGAFKAAALYFDHVVPLPSFHFLLTMPRGTSMEEKQSYAAELCRPLNGLRPPAGNEQYELFNSISNLRLQILNEHFNGTRSIPETTKVETLCTLSEKAGILSLPELYDGILAPRIDPLNDEQESLYVGGAIPFCTAVC